MIELNTTWDVVLMLLIAAGVGLIGGLGAAMLDRRGREEDPTVVGRGGLWSSVFLGGIAAVAILYFFPPTREGANAVGGEGKAYDLTELVALSLIVGSAGSSFLLMLQARTLALASAERNAATQATANQATQATATQALSDVADQAASAAKASVNASAPELQAALQRVGAPVISAEQVDQVVSDLADQTRSAVVADLEPHVESAQKLVAAASTIAPETMPAEPVAVE